VHSYYVVTEDDSLVLTTISSIQKNNIIATQFHPEKSGSAGLHILKNFLETGAEQARPASVAESTKLAKRIIACLDVRSNDQGDLVVTKGDQYDVRENGDVRNLGKPVELAKRYYMEGADEITFLNITGFRDFPLEDMPMLEVLRQTSKNVFVPLTIGGGIKDYTDKNGRTCTALEVATEYFRSGADKVSIGSDAVMIVEEYLKTGRKTGRSSIEEISRVYGNQAVVISIDPKRVYVKSADMVKHQVIETAFPGPNGERYCWYQCTIKGGREGRDLDAITLAQVCEKLGAGEILLNCIDRDGTNLGFDIELINAVKNAVSIPVIASSGAGGVEHFYEVFTETEAESALAAGIFHRKEVPIANVKNFLEGIRPYFLIGNISQVCKRYPQKFSIGIQETVMNLRSHTILQRPRWTKVRALFKSMGYSDVDLDRPLIGIANSWNRLVPGHTNLRQVAEYRLRRYCQRSRRDALYSPLARVNRQQHRDHGPGPSSGRRCFAGFL
jgi:glutamine amidotransferase/cyclase